MLQKDENKMNGQKPEFNNRCTFAAKLALIAMLTSVSVAAIAGPTIAGPKWQSAEEVAEKEEAEKAVTYVDSVTTWGAWELDIEPAAGGITPASTGVLNARNSKVALRTNSIAALAPTPQPAQPVVITNTPTPVPPAAPPAIPTVYIPTVTYVTPGTPIPVGAP